MENESAHVKAKRILVIFPKDYTLREAYNRVLDWNPDRVSLKWGIVNDVPYIYAEKESKFSIKTKVLQSKGINILSGDRIQRIPSLDNPPLGDTQHHPNNTPQNPTISPEFKELLTEVVRDACASKNIDGNIDENISSQIENLKSTLKDRERTINSLKISLKESKDQMGSSIASLNDQIEGLRDTLIQREDTINQNNVTINQKNELIQSLLDQLKSYQPDPTDTRDTTDAPTDTRDTSDAPSDTRDTSDTDDPEAKYQDINAIVKLAAAGMAVKHEGYRIGADRAKNSSGTITGAIVFLRKGGIKSYKKTYSFTNVMSFADWLSDNY